MRDRIMRAVRWAMLGALAVGIVLQSPPAEASPYECIYQPGAVERMILRNAAQSGNRRILESSSPADLQAFRSRLQPSEVRMSDAVWRGYVLPASQPQTKSILLLMGNAQLCEASLLRLMRFDESASLYCFDYPGLGGSDGSPRLSMLIAGAERVLAHVRDQSEDLPIQIIGLSLGGVIAAVMDIEGLGVDRLVLDSTPTTLAIFNCPQIRPTEAVMRRTIPVLVIYSRNETHAALHRVVAWRDVRASNVEVEDYPDLEHIVLLDSIRRGRNDLASRVKTFLSSNG